MKKLILLVLALVLVFSSVIPTSWAQQKITVVLDGTALNFDAQPFIDNGRTMVPFRAIFEALGASVNWDEASQTVTGTKGDTNIILTIDSNTATINGEIVALDSRPQIRDSRTFVPTRFVAENFGVRVYWNNSSSTVVLLSDKIDPSEDSKYIAATDLKDPEEASNSINTATKGSITFWHFNKDEGPNMVNAFNKRYPNVRVNLSIIPDKDQQYQNKLTSAIRAGSGAPDVFTAESAFVKRFVDAPDCFDDLTTKAKDIKSNMYQFALDVGTDQNGKLRALSHQIAPVSFGYKKGLALKYLGTSDPLKISQMLSTPENILKTASALKSKSGGTVALFPTWEELFRTYLGGRSSGWVVGNKLKIDQKMLDFFDMAKTLRANGYESALDQWSPGWSSAIAADNKALCWAIPSWGVPWIIGSNDNKAANGGRWALANPVYANYWGGSWMGIYAKSSNKQTAFGFVKFFTSDKAHLKQWSIDNQDLPNNKDVIMEFSSGSSYTSSITGQNNAKIFGSIAEKINGKLSTKYDDTIENAYDDVMRSYLNGKIKSKDDAINAFKDKVKINLKDIYVE
ncbi:MAG: extracellular solute-binding protein [Bacillota bacterium]|nr:extracellular solute-binding protein [Bacillota bacterium]